MGLYFIIVIANARNEINPARFIGRIIGNIASGDAAFGNNVHFIIRAENMNRVDGPHRSRDFDEDPTETP